MTGDGRIVEVQGTAEKTPFTQDELLALLALAKKGVARLVDLQKIAVAIDNHASPDHRQARHRDPQSRQARRDARTARALRRSRRSPPASSGLASPKRPARPFTPMRGSRRSPRRRRPSCRPLPMIPASWSMRSTARPAFTRRAGPDRTRISTRRWRGSSGCCRSAARRRRPAHRAFRLRALRRLARRSSRRGRGARRRHAGLAAARHRRLRLRSDVPARRLRSHFRRDDQHREARPAAARPRPVASRPRLREARGDCLARR